MAPPILTDRMKTRRRVVLALGAGALVVPLAGLAQQAGRVYRIGFLSGRSRSTQSNPIANYDAFFQAMRELGYVEGRNLVVEHRYGEGKYERLPELAAELVNLNLDVIAAVATPEALAAQRATSIIPVVATSVADPVASGLAKNLARPGGNITGLSNISSDLAPKLLELLKEVKPSLSRVVLLINPANPTHPAIADRVQSAAKQIGATVAKFEASGAQQIERAFSLMADARSVGLVVASDQFFVSQSALIARLAIKSRLPAVFPFRDGALAGGLMSYGPSVKDLFRRAATFVDKILKGAKPGDLPFEQPIQFELVVNMKTADALGIKIPQSLLLRADEVIQ